MKRTCKFCKIKFIPQYNPLQETCDFECAINLKKQRDLKKGKKDWRKEKKKRKEALKTTSDYVRELQVVFNTYIRLRDKNKPCISSGRPLNSKFDAGHFFSTGSYPELRFNEDNVHGQSVHDNRDKHGNLIDYREGLINRIGIDRVNKLYELKNIPRKYTIPELKELKVYYKEKIKELKKVS